MSYTGLYIAIDFDGTCVTHEYPYIGQDVGAVPVLRELVEQGHNLILYTMRSGKLEKEAVQWFKDNGIPLYSVNSNPTQKKWTKSPKVHADVYIDDAGLGCPIMFIDGVRRPVVNWRKVREQLEYHGYL